MGSNDPEREGAAVENSCPVPSEGRGRERFGARLKASLIEGAKGFAAGFAETFLVFEIGAPLLISTIITFGYPTEGASTGENLYRITALFTEFLTDSQPSRTFMSLLMGFGGGIVGGEMMGAYRFVTPRYSPNGHVINNRTP